MAYRPVAERIPNSHKERPKARIIRTPKGLDPELYKEFRKLAKRADQRMVRLEKYAQRPEYEAVLKYSYKNLQSDLKRFASQRELEKLKKGEPLRSNVVPRNDREMQARISAIQRFLESASSTIKKTRQQNAYTGQWEVKPGVEDVYEQRARTLTNMYGMRFDWKTMGTMFKDEFFKQAKKDYGSDETMMVISEMVVGSLNKDAIKKMRAGANIKFMDVPFKPGALGSGLAGEAIRKAHDVDFAVRQFFVDDEARKRTVPLMFSSKQVAEDAERMFKGKSSQEIVSIFEGMGLI